MSGIETPKTSLMNAAPRVTLLGTIETDTYTHQTVGVVARHKDGDYWQDPALIPFPSERFGPLETALIGDPERILHPTHFAKPGSPMIRHLYDSTLIEVTRTTVTKFTLKESN